MVLWHNGFSSKRRRSIRVPIDGSGLASFDAFVRKFWFRPRGGGTRLCVSGSSWNLMFQREYLQCNGCLVSLSMCLIRVLHAFWASCRPRALLEWFPWFEVVPRPLNGKPLVSFFVGRRSRIFRVDKRRETSNSYLFHFPSFLPWNFSQKVQCVPFPNLLLYYCARIRLFRLHIRDYVISSFLASFSSGGSLIFQGTSFLPLYFVYFIWFSWVDQNEGLFGNCRKCGGFVVWQLLSFEWLRRGDPGALSPLVGVVLPSPLTASSCSVAGAIPRESSPYGRMRESFAVLLERPPSHEEIVQWMEKCFKAHHWGFIIFSRDSIVLMAENEDLTVRLDAVYRCFW